jgi:hypothetical protein
MPLPDDEERLDAWHEDTPVRYRNMDNVLGEVETAPDHADRVLDELDICGGGQG